LWPTLGMLLLSPVIAGNPTANPPASFPLRLSYTPDPT